MNKTSIEWTDFTVNPFRFRNLETGKVGHYCEKISPGCKLCYADAMQKGPYLSGLGYILSNKPKGELFVDEGVLQQVLRRKKPARIFWCDMTDMFLADYPDEWIDRCFAVMALTPHLTHQVLTKRADRMREYFSDGIGFRRRVCGTNCACWDSTPAEERICRIECECDCHDEFEPLPNVHLGVSVEDQQRANERYEPMRALAEQGWTTWVSYEPALELVNWWGWSSLKWLVIGGESGPKARPFDIAWARNAIAQCKAAGVACFVKQLGAKPILSETWANEEMEWPEHVLDASGVEEDNNCNELIDAVVLRDPKGGDMSEWPADLRVRQTPEVRHV